jgi:NAD-dependent deacetylase
VDDLGQAVREAAARLRSARGVCILTGAGISAESGIPTFRDAMTGLWSRFSPEELASPEGFLRDPERVWAWYEERRAGVKRASPNPGHRALADLQSRVPRLTLVTQNVDGLHQRAGSRGVLEYHGNILRDRCIAEETVSERAGGGGAALPRCAGCGALLRPDVVWFGEPIPSGPLIGAAEAAAACDVFLSIGTSSLVYPAAGLAYAALDAGATVIECNPNPTDLTPLAHVVLAGPAGELLPRVLGQLR